MRTFGGSSSSSGPSPGDGKGKGKGKAPSQFDFQRYNLDQRRAPFTSAGRGLVPNEALAQAMDFGNASVRRNLELTELQGLHNFMRSYPNAVNPALQAQAEAQARHQYQLDDDDDMEEDMEREALDMENLEPYELDDFEPPRSLPSELDMLYNSISRYRRPGTPGGSSSSGQVRRNLGFGRGMGSDAGEAPPSSATSSQGDATSSFGLPSSRRGPLSPGDQGMMRSSPSASSQRPLDGRRPAVRSQLPGPLLLRPGPARPKADTHEQATPPVPVLATEGYAEDDDDEESDRYQTEEEMDDLEVGESDLSSMDNENEHEKTMEEEDEEDEEDVVEDVELSEEDNGWRPPAALLRQKQEEGSEEEEEDDEDHPEPPARFTRLHELVFPKQPLLCADETGEPRGACQACGKCDYWVSQKVDLRWWPLDHPKEPGDPQQCEHCGCPVQDHTKLTKWMDEVTQKVDGLTAPPASTCPRRISGSMLMAQQLRRNHGMRRHLRLPAVAPLWDAEEAAFFIITDGAYDPRLDGRGQSRASTARPAETKDLSKIFVSVICPTMDSRHPFHETLYTNFTRQKHERKELIVIDTGKRPSPFFTELDAAGYHNRPEDYRVTYKFYPTRDAQEEPNPPELQGYDRKKVKQRLASFEDRFRRKGARPARRNPLSPWSLGFKRNLACHLARGSVIAHFDDDDLYSPDYLSSMLRSLCGNVRDGLGLATLREWHLVDLADQTFGFLSPELDPLVPECAKEGMVLGYGFTYMYTRATWELCPFPDVDWCEDGEFVDLLRQKGVPITLVRSNPKTCTSPGGLACHTYHRATTSGGEFAGFLRLGDPVPVPDSFSIFLPSLRELAEVLHSRISEVHWLRRELKDQGIIRCPPTNLTIREEHCGEVGLKAKDRLLKGCIMVPRQLQEDYMTGPPGRTCSLQSMGGIQLRTMPSSRVRFPENWARRSQAELAAVQVHGDTLPMPPTPVNLQHR